MCADRCAARLDRALAMSLAVREAAAEPRLAGASAAVSAVICAYADARGLALDAAVRSVSRQTHPPHEIVVVIDHNPALLARARRELDRVTVVENRNERGLSGARNTGVACSSGDVVAFLDDDAVAEPDWLERLVAPYDDPAVAGVGGTIEPRWLAGRPAGFPAEFEWVVGCTYKGGPCTPALVRNLIGANMSFRRDVLDRVGGFRADIGRTGRLPTGCEETELCIRTRQRVPHAVFRHEPRARVAHMVPPGRASWRYFRARCFAEGISKAQVSASTGPRDGLASERAYVLRTLPAGAARGLADALRGDASGLVRSAAIVAGLAVTTTGYLAGAARTRRGRRIPVATGALRVLELDLADPLPDVEATVGTHRYGGARLLVRLSSEPLGMLSLDLRDGDIAARDLASRIWRELAEPINARMRSAGRPPLRELPATGVGALDDRIVAGATAAASSFSVVVITCGRVDRLAVCLDTILAGERQPLELVVVDNAPSRPATAELLRRRYAEHQDRIRRVAEPRPGAARARNAGLAAARAPYVAFVDDDVTLDRRWLAAISEAFSAAADVGAVTALILPRELETPAQRWLEQFGGFAKGWQRRVFDLDAHRAPDPLYPYSPGIYGSGASMAFDARTLRDGGGFDPRLSMGGEDLDAFLQVLLGGHRLVYEPSAIAWHRHPPGQRAMRRTMFRYGTGLTALMTKWFLSDPATARAIAARLPSALRLALKRDSRKNAGKRADYPPALTRIERAGMLAGPLLYAAACGRARADDAC
jgi:GT2 family glycosyltransferase